MGQFNNQMKLSDSADCSNLSKQDKQSSGGSSELSQKSKQKFNKQQKKEFFFKKSQGCSDGSGSGSGEKDLSDYPFQGKIIPNVKTHKGSL